MRVVRLDKPTRTLPRSHALTLPNVIGLPLRDAVRLLNTAGYRVQLDGSGRITAVTPLRGNVVHVTAQEVTP